MEYLLPSSALNKASSSDKSDEEDTTHCTKGGISSDALRSIVALDLATPANNEMRCMDKQSDTEDNSPTSTPRNSVRRMTKHHGGCGNGFLVTQCRSSTSSMQKQTPKPIQLSTSQGNNALLVGPGDNYRDDSFAMQEHFREPCLNVSDDDSKNPILAGSVRSARRMIKTASSDAEMQRSIKVLGESRCWTDRLDGNENMGDGLLDEIFENEDDILATQTPIRSLSSYVPTQCSPSTFSRNATSSSSPLRSRNRSSTPLGTPIRSTQRTYGVTCTPNRFTQRVFESGDASDLTAFGGARLNDVRMEPMNILVNASVPKECLVSSLNGEVGLLYTHFKNLCAVLRRCAMRSSPCYFMVIRLLVQRMSRKNFTMEHLLRMAWMAPNLLNVKNVIVHDRIRQKYATEYKDCRTDVIQDVQIRIYKRDGRGYCCGMTDYENSCLRFKSILCAWVLRCKSEMAVAVGVGGGGIVGDAVTGVYTSGTNDDKCNFNDLSNFNCDSSLPIPLLEVGSEALEEMQPIVTHLSVNTSTSASASTAGTTTPVRSCSRLHLNTPTSSTRASLKRPLLMDCGGATFIDDCLYDDDDEGNFGMDMRVGTNLKTPSITIPLPDGTGDASVTSRKRNKINEMSPMSLDLLDTPGMRRIRENARKLAQEASSSGTDASTAAGIHYDKEHDLNYWKDMQWFVEMLSELSMDDNVSPVMRLDWLCDYVNKYASRKATMNEIEQWATTLADIAPHLLDKSISKFDDYATIITVAASSFQAPRQFVKNKIQQLSNALIK